MPQSSFDAVIIGAGHNGLIAACYLAQAGHRVLILEKNADVGGATLSKRIFPGIDARVLGMPTWWQPLAPKNPVRFESSLPNSPPGRCVLYPNQTPGHSQELLINNYSEEITQKSFLQIHW